MMVWSGNMRESATWRDDRATAELPTVHAAAPTSYMVPILATAWTMDNSRIRVPHNGKQDIPQFLQHIAPHCVAAVLSEVESPSTKAFRKKRGMS